jgi:hypothetical protein
MSVTFTDSNRKTIVPGQTKITMGDWRLEIHRSGLGTGYRRYHRHKTVWYCVVSSPDTQGGVTPATKSGGFGWKCGHCQEPVPKEMEGFINLARYSLNED